MTGCTFDDFETTTLIASLKITYAGNGFNATNTSLPQVLAWSGGWAGAAIVSNDPVNGTPGNGTWPSLITFIYSPGASSIGIGLGGFQSLDPPSDAYPVTNHRLYINGTVLPDTLETLGGTNWTGSWQGRDAYLRVDAVAGEVITSIAFENIQQASGLDDLLFFSHFAVRPVPRLEIRASAPMQVALSWPTNAVGYVLESAAALPASLWSQLTNAPVTVGNQFTVGVDATNGQQFFRLRAQ